MVSGSLPGILHCDGAKWLNHDSVWTLILCLLLSTVPPQTLGPSFSKQKVRITFVWKDNFVLQSSSSVVFIFTPESRYDSSHDIRQVRVWLGEWNITNPLSGWAPLTPFSDYSLILLWISFACLLTSSSLLLLVLFSSHARAVSLAGMCTNRATHNSARSQQTSTTFVALNACISLFQ